MFFNWLINVFFSLIWLAQPNWNTSKWVLPKKLFTKVNFLQSYVYVLIDHQEWDDSKCLDMKLYIWTKIGIKRKFTDFDQLKWAKLIKFNTFRSEIDWGEGNPIKVNQQNKIATKSSQSAFWHTQFSIGGVPIRRRFLAWVYFTSLASLFRGE